MLIWRTPIQKVVFVIALKSTSLLAQISPPGLDDTHVVVFSAISISQSLGRRWVDQFYIGGSRFSDPDNNKILKKQAIFIVEEQIHKQFGKHWQLGICVSYRGQNMYSDLPPYDFEIPSLRRELRYYPRIYYKHQKGKLSFTYSLRPEFRNFYSPDWVNFYATPQAFRYRMKAQMGFIFGSKSNNWIILADEVLFVQVEQRQPSSSLSWTRPDLSEDRITSYYRHSFKKPSIMVDFGVMQQLNYRNGDFLADYVHFAFDLIIIDPFGKPNGK